MTASSAIARLRALQSKATPGEWQLQDSCSWRRIGTLMRDGNVLCPTNHPTDRHPDLTAGRGEDIYDNLRIIVAAMNALPALLECAEALSPMLRGLKEADYYCPDDVAEDHTVLISVTIAELREARAALAALSKQ